MIARPGTEPVLGDKEASRWRSAAACRSADPDMFFPISESGPAREQTAKAKAVCATCPVRRECLGFALRTGQMHGIWGGTTEYERAAAWRRASRLKEMPPRSPTRRQVPEEARGGQARPERR